MPDIANTNGAPLQLPSEGHGSFEFWKKEILAAAAKRDEDFKPNWDRNIASYQAKSGAPTPSVSDTDAIVVPKDFANVEQKRAQLFFQLPKVLCKAMRPDAEDSAPLVQAILRFYLGPQRVDAMKMMGECLFDTLCPAGLMVSKIGYESVQDGVAMVPVQVPAPEMPSTGPTPLGAVAQPGAAPPGSVLGLNTPPPPQTITIQRPAPRIISERYFWDRWSPAKALIPDGFSGSNYDKAPWLGGEVELSALRAQQFRAEDDLKLQTGDDEHRLKSEPSERRSTEEKVRAFEIWYKASLYDPNEKNPDKIRYMLILDGDEEPVRHADSPYQRFDPMTGRLTLGMRGFPIHIGALRYVSDSAYPPSECTISHRLGMELNRFRQQMVTLRDRAIPQILADMMRLGGAGTLEKMRRGEYAGIIPVPNLDVSNPPLFAAPVAHMNPDSYRGNDYIDRDMDTVWGLGPNQHGQEAAESRSATEMSIAQGNAKTRLSAERRDAMAYFAAGATKLLSLLQLFQDREEFVEIVGDDGARRLEAWDRTKIASEYLIEIKPDSSAQFDVAQDRSDLLKLYELTAKDPNGNRVELLHRMAPTFDLDPARWVVTQLPPKGPEPAGVSFSFKLEDLDIGNPNFPVVMFILQQNGYAFPPEMIQRMQQHAQLQQLVMAHAGVGPGIAPAGAPPSTPQPPNTTHPGTAPRAERLNKHQERNSTNQPGFDRSKVQ